MEEGEEGGEKGDPYRFWLFLLLIYNKYFYVNKCWNLYEEELFLSKLCDINDGCEELRWRDGVPGENQHPLYFIISKLPSSQV